MHRQRITSVRVGGFKALAQVQDLRIGSLTVLAGANSSGKSSALQPLLLLKQSIQSARGGSDLVLSGGHVQFTDKAQILTSPEIFADGDPCPLTIGLTLDGVDKMCQTYSSQNGKPLSISSVHYCLPRYGSHDFELRPDMSTDEMERALGRFLQLINESYKPVGFKAVVDSGILSVAMDLSFTATDKEGKQTPALYAFEVPFREPFIRAVSDIIHVQGVRGIQRQSLNIPRTEDSFSSAVNQYSASLLFEWQETEDPRLKKLTEYLIQLQLTSAISAKLINDSVIELKVARSLTIPDREKHVSIADVGFGVAQVLPVLLALLVASENQVVYIEQPEVHLHPNAQVMLARVICDAVQRNVQVVIETHSELMLLGIQTAVAQGQIDPKSVALHWFTRDPSSGQSVVSMAEVGRDGSWGEWPSDFSCVTLDAQMAYLRSINALVPDK